jgi:hypothetical protein
MYCLNWWMCKRPYTSDLPPGGPYASAYSISTWYKKVAQNIISRALSASFGNSSVSVVSVIQTRQPIQNTFP